jgi:hypothetical protein
MIRLSSQSYPRYRRALQPDLWIAHEVPRGLIIRRLQTLETISRRACLLNSELQKRTNQSVNRRRRTLAAPDSTQHPLNRKSRILSSRANNCEGNGVMPYDLPSRLGMLTPGTISAPHRETPSWIVTPHR